MSQNEDIIKKDLLYDTMRLLTQPFVNIGSIIKQKHRYDNTFRSYLGVESGEAIKTNQRRLVLRVRKCFLRDYLSVFFV